MSGAVARRGILQREGPRFSIGSQYTGIEDAGQISLGHEPIRNEESAAKTPSVSVGLSKFTGVDEARASPKLTHGAFRHGHPPS